MVASVAMVTVMILGQKDKFANWPMVPATNGYSDYLAVARKLKLRNSAGTEKLSSVERGRLLRTYLQGALETIEQGNRKPTTDGRRNRTMATLYPELVEIKQIGRVIPDIVDAEFADRHPDAAFRWLRAGLVFSERLPMTTAIFIAINRAVALYILRSVVTHRSELSKAQLTEIDEILATQEPTIDQYIRATMDDADQTSRFIDEIAVDPKVIGLPEGNDLEQITKFCRDTDLTNMYKSDYRNVISKRASVFRQSERLWLTPSIGELAGNISTRNMAFLQKHMKNAFGMFKFMSLMEKLDVGVGTYQTAIVARTRTRIARLEIAIELQRRRTGKRPKQLTEFQPKALIFDPLTGKPFLYSGEEVWSQGLPQTGPIHLAPAKR